MVLIEHHSCSLDWLEGVAVLNGSGHHHGIDSVSCREDEGISGEHIAFIIVGNRVCHVQSICLVAVKIALEIDHDTLVLNLELRGFFQRRGEVKALRILHHNILVKCQFEFCLMSRYVYGSC